VAWSHFFVAAERGRRRALLFQKYSCLLIIIKKKKKHIIFVYRLEKAYDRVPGEVLKLTLRRKEKRLYFNNIR